MNAKFQGILRSVGEVPDAVTIDGTHRFTDLGVDSLKLLDILVNVEAEFDIEIEGLERFTTVGELWEHVELLTVGT